MLRVAILSAFPDRLDSPAGGVQAVARNLALGLGQRGDIDLHVVTSRPGLKQSRSVRLAERITVHSVPRLGRLELPTLFLHDRLVLGQVLRRLDAEVVHAHEARYAYACGAMRSPYLLTVHGFWSTEEQTAARSEFKARARLPLVRLVEGRSIQRAQVIVANSRYVLRQLSPSCRAKAIYIPNPVDPLFYAPGPPEPRPGRITWVGRLIPLKAVDVLLQALPAVRRAVPTAHLRLVGPCPEAAECVRI